jgi:polysaccharide biosynthesis/export protein
MSQANLPIRVPLLAVLAAAILVVLAGCRPFDYYDQTLQQPVPPPLEIPRELSKVSLPAYRVEPPDLLQIEVLKLVPLPPYRTEIFDVLQVQVVGTLLDQPVDGFYLIEGEGTVNLGPAYGTVRVVGMTIEETKAAITEQLKQVLKEPVVSVQLARTAGTQQITGVYLVGPDGTINLRQYGSVHVAGKTLVEIRLAIQRQLAEFFDSPEVSVDMAGYNSKVYYIITEGAGLGDNVVRVPVTGNETLLDAISQVGGLSQLSSKKIHIARPAPGGFGCEQILPIDWVAISRGGASATNYQLMPGDRVFITEEPLVATNNYLVKLISPVERLLGVTSLGISTVRSSQLMGRDFNRYRNG